MKIHQLLRFKKSWTQGSFGRLADGTFVSSLHGDATSWCLAGAINKCYPDGLERWKHHKSISEYTGESAMLWNDKPERTHAEVLALVRKLDI